MAARKVGTHDLSGSVLFMAGYSCPMWYHRVGSHRTHLLRRQEMEDALEYGDFDESMNCAQFPLPKDQRKLSNEQLLRDDILKAWKEFNALPDHVHS